MPYIPPPSSGGGGGSGIPPFSVGGPLAATSHPLRIYVARDCTISSVRASVGTPSSGAPIVVDVNRNGTSIFTNQANRPSIAAGAYTDLSGTPDVVALAAGDYLTIDVDSVGSTVTGSHLTVQVETA